MSELARTAVRLRQIASLNPEMAATVTYNCKEKCTTLTRHPSLLLELRHGGTVRIVCAAKLWFFFNQHSKNVELLQSVPQHIKTDATSDFLMRVGTFQLRWVQ